MTTLTANVPARRRVWSLADGLASALVGTGRTDVHGRYVFRRFQSASGLDVIGLQHYGTIILEVWLNARNEPNVVQLAFGYSKSDRDSINKVLRLLSIPVHCIKRGSVLFLRADLEQDKWVTPLGVDDHKFAWVSTQWRTDNSGLRPIE